MSKSNEFDTHVAIYNRDGYAIVPMHSHREQRVLQHFAKSWINRLLIDHVDDCDPSVSLDKYHTWSRDLPNDHRNVFRALNRYAYPPADVMDALVNERMKGWLQALGITEYKIWDDGWGHVGFRFVRPGVGDGYPLCAKDWGIAKGVVSFWIPIIGHSAQETLTLVPGSHTNEYPKSVTDDKFAKGEPRFCGDVATLKLVKPDLSRGDVICYSSKTMHSEEVIFSDITRLNLEIRFQPVGSQ